MCCISVQVAPSLSYLLLPHTLKELFKAKKLSAAVTLNCTNAHPKAHTMAMLSESLVWHTKITMLHCLDIVKSHYAVHFRTHSMRRRQIKAGFTLLKPIFPTPHRAKKVCHLNRSQRPLTWLLIAHRLTPFGTVRKNGYYAFELSVLPVSLKETPSCSNNLAVISWRNAGGDVRRKSTFHCYTKSAAIKNPSKFWFSASNYGKWLCRLIMLMRSCF